MTSLAAEEHVARRAAAADPDTTSNSVVLPAPLGPTRPTIARGRDGDAHVGQRDEPAEAHGDVARLEGRSLRRPRRRRLGGFDQAHDCVTSAACSVGTLTGVGVAVGWVQPRIVAARRTPWPPAPRAPRSAVDEPLVGPHGLHVHRALGVLGEHDRTDTEEQDRAVAPTCAEVQLGREERG